MNTHPITLTIVTTLGLALALPSAAHAMAPPQPMPLTSTGLAESVDSAAEPPAAQPTPPSQAAPTPPPPTVAPPRYDHAPAHDVAPPPSPNRGLGLTIAGFSTFGASYLAAVAGGASVGGVGILAIPIAGPFVAGGELLALSPLLGGLGAGLGVALIFDGVAQAVGLGLGIAGAVTLGKARRQARLSATPGGVRVQF